MSKYTKEQLEKLLQGCETLEQFAEKLGLNSKQAAFNLLVSYKVSRRKVYWPLTK